MAESEAVKNPCLSINANHEGCLAFFAVAAFTSASIAVHLDSPGSNGRTAPHRPVHHKLCIFWDNLSYCLTWRSY